MKSWRQNTPRKTPLLGMLKGVNSQPPWRCSFFWGGPADFWGTSGLLLTIQSQGSPCRVARGTSWEGLGHSGKSGAISQGLEMSDSLQVANKNCSRGSKRRFCYREVLANVPFFRCFGSRNIENRSFLLPGALQGKIVGEKFQYRRTSAKTTLLETTMSCEPLKCLHLSALIVNMVSYRCWVNTHQ